MKELVDVYKEYVALLEKELARLGTQIVVRPYLAPAQEDVNKGAELREKIKTLTLQYEELNKVEWQPLRHDIGLGKCKEKNCNNWAEKDYNGHQHYVCQPHYDQLNNEFDEEYR